MLCGLQSAVVADGLLLFSTPGSSYVNAVQYETFTSTSAHLSYVTIKGGKHVQIKSAGIIAHIPFPDTASNVFSKDAEAMITRSEIYAAQYPKYAKLLQGVGDLWRRHLEESKVAQSRPTPSPLVFQTTNNEPATISEGVDSKISVIKTKSGQTLKNVRIFRFEDDKAVISHDGGMGRLLISDIADISTLPVDAQSAIEKAREAADAARKAEKDRLAGGTQEKWPVQSPLADITETSGEPAPQSAQGRSDGVQRSVNALQGEKLSYILNWIRSTLEREKALGSNQESEDGLTIMVENEGVRKPVHAASTVKLSDILNQIGSVLERRKASESTSNTD